MKMKMSNNVQPIYNYNIFAFIYVRCVECNTEIKFLLNLYALVAVVIVGGGCDGAAATVFRFYFLLIAPDTNTYRNCWKRN